MAKRQSGCCVYCWQTLLAKAAKAKCLETQILPQCPQWSAFNCGGTAVKNPKLPNLIELIFGLCSTASELRIVL